MRTDRKYYHLDSANSTLLFENELVKLGIHINKDSDLYRIGYSVLETYEKQLNSSLHDNSIDLRESMSEVMGFNNYIEKLFPILTSDYKDSIKPHLELLNNSSIPQTKKSRITDQGSNKLFELYMASLCYPQFQNIKLDSPKKSKGDNPDIMFEYKGRTWGIACKVLHTSKPQTIFDNVVKAIDQIEKSKSDSGFVFLSLKNIIDYDDIWPILNKSDFINKKTDPVFGSFISPNIPVKKLESYVFKLQNDLATEFGNSIFEIFHNKKSQPVIVVFLQAATGLIKENSPVFSLLGFLGMIRINYIPDFAIEVLKRINERIN